VSLSIFSPYDLSDEEDKSQRSHLHIVSHHRSFSDTSSLLRSAVKRSRVRSVLVLCPTFHNPNRTSSFRSLSPLRSPLLYLNLLARFVLPPSSPSADPIFLSTQSSSCHYRNHLPALKSLDLPLPPSLDTLSKSIAPSIASKQSGNEAFLADLVSEAALAVMPKNPKDFSVDAVRVVKILGGSLSQSRVVRGMVFGREPDGQSEESLCVVRRIGSWTKGG
jgi:hypothetical protein